MGTAVWRRKQDETQESGRQWYRRHRLGSCRSLSAEIRTKISGVLFSTRFPSGTARRDRHRGSDPAAEAGMRMYFKGR